MTPAIAALLAFLAYFVGYRFYSKYLAEKIFQLDPAAVTPAHALRDDVDYLPTEPPVLFGHHYASITGLAPMLGPAVAVIWGWLPALLWVVFGSILIGCVHDFSALVISVRSRGKSVGEVAESVMGARARTLFHLIIFFGIALAMGVFVFIIAQLFSVEMAGGAAGYPQAVLPSGLLMVVAMVSGFLMHRRGVGLVPVAVVGFTLELAFVAIGTIPDYGAFSWWPSAATWTWVLLGYAFAACVLPVWALLQARDFLNSLLLYLGLGLAYIGLFVGNPEFVAPPVVAHPEGAPPLFPFVFIIIACGAASGFHGLVSSGTTAKQLDKETHARPIGFGGMIGESLLGLLATLACTAGLASRDVWHGVYRDWSSISTSLAAKIGAFIDGTTTFMVALGLPSALASALIAMVVVSFALTTLDSATRLLRFNIEEIGGSLGLPGTGNRFFTSALACAVIGFFAFYEVGGKPAGLALWALFGTTNQLLAGLTLTLVTLYLRQRGRNPWLTGVPAAFMLISTLLAMGSNLAGFFPSGDQGDVLLFAVGSILMGLGVWLLVEAILSLVQRPATSGD